MGSGGYCLCPKCGNKVPHKRGVPCLEERCPSCGARLVREGSYHHQQIIEKKKKNSE
ncbi:MAG: ferredoxin [Calditrichaeota bacterium]|nr:ferredoxin [Calditrichota bacterium]